MIETGKGKEVGCLCKSIKYRNFNIHRLLLRLLLSSVFCCLERGLRMGKGKSVGGGVRKYGRGEG